MFLKAWRFITLVLVALTMGMTFAHVLELPPKMQYDGPLYVTVQNTLYQLWGAPGPGAFVVVGAVFTAIVLTYLVRDRGMSFYLTLAGTSCLLVAFPVIFFLFTEPANEVFRAATPESVPTDWEQWRAQWEYSHTASFVFNLTGFSLLVLSILVETPDEGSREQSPAQ